MTPSGVFRVFWLFAMSVRPSQLPSGSDLHQRLGAGDFLDCYAIAPTNPDLAPLEYAVRLANMPGWVTALLALRNLVVAPLGLKTSFGTGQASTEPAIGDYVGIFRLEKATDSEAILGENDKHLDFRIAVHKSEGPQPIVYLATWVHPHNWLGRSYLATVMPFHKLIVQRMLATLA